MKNVVVRSISGLVYILLIVGAILSGWKAFYGLTALFAILAMLEYSNLAGKLLPAGQTNTEDTDKDEEYDDSAMHYVALLVDMIGAVILTVFPLMLAYWVPSMAASLFAGYVVLRLVISLYDRRAHALREAAKSILGTIYIGLPLGILNTIYTLNPDGQNTPMFVLIIFVMIWLNDTGAYCVGSTMGRHRLFERLSPKKSWEGFWGGLVFTAAFGAVCYYSFNDMGMTLTQWVVTGLLVSVFATWGDLFESMVKRTVGVKDSGAIIPGHGGILDRIDSLLMVAPAVYIFLSFIQ